LVLVVAIYLEALRKMGTDSNQNISGHNGRRIRGLTGTSYENIETWPTPDEGVLSESKLADYLRRKLGVKLYLEGQPEKAIRKACGLGIKQIYRLIRERCLEVHGDGLIYGMRGLIRYAHIKPYKRKINVKVDVFGQGAAGAMQSVLDIHPELRKKFEERILERSKGDKLGPIKRARQSHWKWFLDQLRNLGYEIRHEWPFSTQTNGYNSVCRYIDRVLESNPRRAAEIVGGPDTAKKLMSGDGVDRPVNEIFKRVEMDAHKLDGRFCVMLPLPSGEYIPKIIHRLWVIVILEIISKAVLGYHLSLRKEVSKEDVLRTIKKALSAWHPRRLAFSTEIVYRDGAGLPSSNSPKFLHACWSETSVDGALAETCKHVKDVLKNVVGSELIEPKGKGSFSVRRSKDDRPFIEAFFKNLASRGFQKLSNTTGGKSADKKGRNPDVVAIKSRFQYEYAEELLDVLIANYNVTPHTSLGNRSPLEYLNFIEARGMMNLRYAEPDFVQQIVSYRKECIVKGGINVGRRPYVNFEGACYSNEILAQRHDLVGSKISVVNHLEYDARIAKASTLNGQSLGVLRASPPWHKLPHSLDVRRSINSCIHRRMFVIGSGADAVETFLDFNEQQTDKKLPIHPAYLEARRILIGEAELQTGQSMLDAALERANTKKEKSLTNSSGIDDKKGGDTQQDPSDKPMPARRLAISQ
jgi:hypothetical protein